MRTYIKGWEAALIIAVPTAVGALLGIPGWLTEPIADVGIGAMCGLIAAGVGIAMLDGYRSLASPDDQPAA